MGGDRRPQDQLAAVHQAPDPAAEGQGQAGLCGPGAWQVQLLHLLHERRLHGMRPGVQVLCGRQGGPERLRQRLRGLLSLFCKDFVDSSLN